MLLDVDLAPEVDAGDGDLDRKEVRTRTVVDDGFALDAKLDFVSDVVVVFTFGEFDDFRLGDEVIITFTGIAIVFGFGTAISFCSGTVVIFVFVASDNFGFAASVAGTATVFRVLDADGVCVCDVNRVFGGNVLVSPFSLDFDAVRTAKR